MLILTIILGLIGCLFRRYFQIFKNKSSEKSIRVGITARVMQISPVFMFALCKNISRKVKKFNKPFRDD